MVQKDQRCGIPKQWMEPGHWDCESDDHIIGFKKRFRYKNINNPREDDMWITHEFTVNSSILEDYSDKTIHYGESQFRYAP